jgi:hypothetical protein
VGLFEFEPLSKDALMMMHLVLVDETGFDAFHSLIA